MNRNVRKAENMNNLQLSYCIKITEKLKAIPLSTFFLQPVDLTQAPDYLKTIPKPMDLGTVSKKLESHQYATVNEWKSDVNLIWKNAKTYNPENTFCYMFADELHRRFKEMSDHIPKTKDEEWVLKLNKCHTKFQKILHAKPF